MAPLEVIGAGYGRTGTDSLRIALNTLGYSTHHMRVIYWGQTNPDDFKNAYENPEEPVDWDNVYEGFNAAVDWPTATFIKRLVKYYPDAKIILTERDPDSWYKSAKNSIFKIAHIPDGENTPDHIRRVRAMSRKVNLDGAFEDPELFADEEAIKRRFVEHNEWVKANVPPEQLLVMQLGEGWERLCKFLNKPVPKEPYPHVNTTAELLANVDENGLKSLNVGRPADNDSKDGSLVSV
ncbi:hypothetical protein O0I10_008594 [Lichtheimia ornata]|uniref:P-loop containing nucleoside triphosphate hydrolase protein n=1 Tax=Lichtheimia ornata TaxID=688661 RepID=A0AAD7UZ92_9FUNG|nr:uncharacterized protein O0I10_008594 [Lichtheimia ornata]KAJ8655709.1 hypothetical protein O0I10_008594 [Lichtheimia ornata]